MIAGRRSECAFCRIANGQNSGLTEEVYRDEHAVAFVPLTPATVGHTLVIPTTHIPDVWRLDEANVVHLTGVTRLLAHAIRQAVRPEGLNIIQSNGPAASQTVPHLHVHLVPRWTGDRLPALWPPENSPIPQERQLDALNQIREALMEPLE